MKYIVYQTTNLINNKIYIGQHKTENPEIFDGYIGCGVRCNIPYTYNNPKTPFQYAVNKYGPKNFNRIILAIFDTRDDALKLEAELVNINFIKRKDTYNIVLGGGSMERYNPINQFDLNGNFIKTWNSVSEASEFYSITNTAILNACNFKGGCLDYYWSRLPAININEYVKGHHPIVYQYSAESGKYLQMFNSVKEAAFFTGVTQQSIGNAIKTGYKIKNFYFSESLLEEYQGKPKISIKNKTIYIYNLEGEFLTELKNGKEICEYFNIKTPNQITVALRKNQPYKQYQISLEKVDKMPPNKLNIYYKREILVYTIHGEFVEELPSVREMELKYSQGARKVLRGSQKQCRGYVFKYKLN